MVEYIELALGPNIGRVHCFRILGLIILVQVLGTQHCTVFSQISCQFLAKDESQRDQTLSYKTNVTLRSMSHLPLPRPNNRRQSVTFSERTQTQLVPARRISTSPCYSCSPDVSVL